MTTPGEGASPFDRVAGEYDSGFGRSPAGRLFRFRLAERVAATMGPGTTLLDVGAGTGEDAAWFAAHGFAVTSIDPSAGMLAIATAKASRLRNPPAFALKGLLEFSAAAPFDGLYSNFGAMNCVRLSEWRAAFERLVKPGGRIFLVLMGRRPIPEALRFGREAWTRRASPTAPVGPGEILVEYPDVSDVARALGPGFHLERTETLGVLVPRPGRDAWPTRSPILFGALAVAEAMLGRFKLLCGYSDHYLIEFTRL